jgi:hypothetical protein
MCIRDSFTTIHFSRYIFEVPNRTHTKMGESLLKNLSKNLNILDQAYKSEEQAISSIKVLPVSIQEQGS